MQFCCLGQSLDKLSRLGDMMGDSAEVLTDNSSQIFWRLKGTKTRPWALPFCVWPCVFVTSWTRPASVAAVQCTWWTDLLLVFIGKKQTNVATPSPSPSPSSSSHYHLSLHREGRWGTTDDFTTSSLHFYFCSPLPSGTWQTSGLSIPWCCLPTSSSVCLVFFHLSLCLAKWFWPDLMNGRHVHTTSVCVSLR